MISLFTTKGGAERAVAADLCDCVYGAGDESVKCEAVAPGVFYIEYKNINALNKCISLFYFKKLLKRHEIYNYISFDEPSEDRKFKKIGKYIFIK